MREYIIYAILIFLPLGFLMACFLHKQGFTKKQISCFTIAALAAVILFPISAAKMGTNATGIIFVLVLALFSWQIMKVEQVPKNEEASKHPEIEKVESLRANADAAPGLVMAEKAATTEPGTTDTEDLPLTDQDKTEPAMIQFIGPATGEDQYAAETEDALSVMVANTENDSQMDILSEPLERTDDNCMEQNETEDYIITQEDEPAPKGEIEDLGPSPETVNISADVFTGEELHEDTDSEHPPVVEVIKEKNNDNTMAEITKETDDNDHTTAEITNEAEDNDHTTAEITNEAEDNDHTTAEIINEADNQDNTQKINSLIDAGFENKINGNVQEAVRCFESAFHLTDSADLKYLLSQELVLHYEILGQYTNAINITKNTMGSGLIPTAGFNQAQHKLEYLQRMVEELERLGMGEVPVSEVPRLVKIKVGQIT